MTSIKLAENSPLLSKNFLFGTATSSFQIEGDAASRLPSIWDTFCATPGKIADGSNGIVACEHVIRWQDDIDLIESLGVDAYRLSISWPRVINQNGELNPDGVAFYTRLLDGLKQKGIKTFVTLYHWDLPQYIEDQGGWLNRETAYMYADYVSKIVPALGDRVDSYATFNEPFCSAFLGYEIGVHAPGKLGRKNGRQAAHHILLAHGLGMAQLSLHSPHTLNGIVLNFTPCYPISQNAADVDACQRANEYINHWYIQPLMEGKYPDVIDLLGDDAPDIHDGDFAIMQAPLDFLGINFYTRLRYGAPRHTDELYEELPHQAPLTDIGWEIYPQALTDWLVSLHERYTLPPIYITENGAAMADKMEGGEVADSDRVAYYDAHLNALSDAIEKGVNVAGYFAWSLMDNFEWAEGYAKRFGLVYVDFDTQERTLKHSALAYKALLNSRT